MHQSIHQNDAPMHYILQAFAENAAMHQQTRKNIRELMLARKTASERQLALDCGMSQSTLNRFMSGATETLDFSHLQSISQYFGVTVSQLIGETPLKYDSKIRAVVAVEDASEPAICNDFPACNCAAGVFDPNKEAMKLKSDTISQFNFRFV